MKVLSPVYHRLFLLPNLRAVMVSTVASALYMLVDFASAFIYFDTVVSLFLCLLIGGIVVSMLAVVLLPARNDLGNLIVVLVLSVVQLLLALFGRRFSLYWFIALAFAVMAVQLFCLTRYALANENVSTSYHGYRRNIKDIYSGSLKKQLMLFAVVAVIAVVLVSILELSYLHTAIITLTVSAVDVIVMAVTMRKNDSRFFASPLLIIALALSLLAVVLPLVITENIKALVATVSYFVLVPCYEWVTAYVVAFDRDR